MRQFNYRRSTSALPVLDKLYKYLDQGLDGYVDLNTFLLQYYDLKDIDDKITGFKFEPRKMIADCKLNMQPAIDRCKKAYKDLNCEVVEYGDDTLNKAPFVTPVCPEGFQRYGSVTCLRNCKDKKSVMADKNAGEDMLNERAWTRTTYCLKHSQVKSEIKRLNVNNVQSVGTGLEDFEILQENTDDFIYVKNCPENFKRIGDIQCMAQCPLGWADFGNKCLKKGALYWFPFVWTPGDGNLSASSENDSKPKN